MGNETNYVVNEVLCFISSALDSKTTDYIIGNCLPFYSQIKIREAKDLLCTLINEKPTRRRGENAIKLELSDIIEIIRKCHEEDLKLPTFVTTTFNSLPPSPGFETMGAVLVDLMDQITCLRNEIKLIKNTAANEKILMDDTAMIKDDLNFIKDRIKSFQPQIDELYVNRLHKEKDISLVSEKSISPLEIEKFEQFLDNYDLGNKKTFDPSAPSLSQLTQGDSYATVSARPPVLRPSSHLKANETTKPEKTFDQNKQPDGFIEVRKRRRNTGIIGTKKDNTSTNIKSANRQLDLYVGNFDSSIACETISEYVSVNNDIKVFDCIELTSNKYFKSFKLSVGSNDRDKLLVSNLWPEGIICRKFYSKINKNTKSN